MLGKIEGRRRRGRQIMRWLEGITDSMDMSLDGVPILSAKTTGFSLGLFSPMLETHCPQEQNVAYEEFQLDRTRKKKAHQFYSSRYRKVEDSDKSIQALPS